MKLFKGIIFTLIFFFGVFFVFKKMVASDFVSSKLVQLINEQVLKKENAISFSKIELSYFPLGTTVKNINVDLSDVKVISLDLEILFFFKDFIPKLLGCTKVLKSKLGNDYRYGGVYGTIFDPTKSRE